MISNVAEFRAVCDELREDRRARGNDPILDLPFIDRLDAIYDRMTDSEYDEINREGWRGWPDQYDRRSHGDK